MRSPSACTPRWAPTWAAPTTAISASRARSTASADAWSGSLVLVRVGLTAPNSYSSRSMNVRIPAALADGRGRRTGQQQEYWVHAAVRGGAANRRRGPRHGRRIPVQRAGRSHRDPPHGRPGTPGDRRLGGRPDRTVHAHRADRGRRRRRRVRGRIAGRDDLLQHLGRSGPRSGGGVPAGDDGAVRGPGAVHRARPGPHAAGAALPAGGHAAGPRPALLGDVGRHQQPGDAAARGVRHPGAAEVLRGGARVGHAAAVARRDHPGDRQRAVPAHHADHLPTGRGVGRRDPGDGRVRLGAARGHADLPRRHVPRAAAPGPGGRAAGAGRNPPAARRGRDGRTLPYEPGALPPGTPAPDEAADGRRSARGRRWRTLANVGPIVGEAMRGNAVLRAFSGYMVFFLAFYLRSANFGVSHNVALGALVAAAAAGGLAAMAIGSLLRSRAPAFILFSMLTLAPIVTATCAWFFSLTTVIAVAFTAALAAGLAKLALDSTVQREIGEEIRSSAFAVSETLNQVANVAGSLAGVLVSILDNGEAGLAIAAAFLTLALVTLVARRRRRILAARAESEAAYAAAQPPPRRPRPRPR